MRKKNPKIIKEFTAISLDDNGKETENTYLLVQPTAKASRDSRWKYSVVYSQAIRDGVLTKRQMQEFLIKQDNEKEEDSQSQENLALYYIEAATLENKLENSKDLVAKLAIADKLKQIRNAIFIEEEEAKAPYYNTAEQKAEDARSEYLLINMVVNKDENNTLVWESEEEFDSETDTVFIEECTNQFFYWMYNMDESWEEKLPENKIMKEVIEEEEKKVKQKKKEERAKKKLSSSKKVTKASAAKKKSSAKSLQKS